jgi:outer membrane protein TolC
MVAASNMRTSDELLRQQVTAIVVEVQNAYWDLAASQQGVLAAQIALELAKLLDSETKFRYQIGAIAGIEMVPTESAVAVAERDLIFAKTTLQLQEAQFKRLLSKRSDAQLEAAGIEITDQLPEPNERDAPAVDIALATALEERPELHIAEANLAKQDITSRFTRNGLLPNISVFSLYAGAGLAGDTTQLTAGAGQSLSQDFAAQYPEYASGVSVVIPIRNRSAQADNLRARLEEQQLEVGMQRLKQQVELEVRQALVSLTEGKSEVAASNEALKLANQALDAERSKLEVGASSTYNVILRQRDLAAARQAQIAASAAYAKALVDMQRASGATLKENGIELDDALKGEMTKRPSLPSQPKQVSSVRAK